MMVLRCIGRQVRQGRQDILAFISMERSTVRNWARRTRRTRNYVLPVFNARSPPRSHLIGWRWSTEEPMPTSIFTTATICGRMGGYAMLHWRLSFDSTTGYHRWRRPPGPPLRHHRRLVRPLRRSPRHRTRTPQAHTPMWMRGVRIEMQVRLRSVRVNATWRTASTPWRRR